MHWPALARWPRAIGACRGVRAYASQGNTPWHDNAARRDWVAAFKAQPLQPRTPPLPSATHRRPRAARVRA